MEFDPEVIKKFKYSDLKSTESQLTRAEKFLKLKQAIGENWFFLALDEINSEWKELNFGFSAANICLTNDSSDLFLFSWNGVSLDGIIMAGEIIQFNQLEREKIFVRHSGKIRIWSY